MIWAAHLVFILQLACWSELACFIGNLVHIFSAPSFLTTDSSHGAHGYIQEALHSAAALCGHWHRDCMSDIVWAEFAYAYCLGSLGSTEDVIVSFQVNCSVFLKRGVAPVPHAPDS